MKRIAFICMLLIQHILFAQDEGNIWYFGANAGIDFNSGVPVALTNGALNTTEGCASISDNNGVLLFYTDGVTVWNSNHLVMPNGTGLDGGGSSCQSAIIVKKPGTNTIYFLFTADELSGSDGLRYSEVDMSLQSGLGDINSNKNIPVVTPICEKVTAIRHQNNIDYWIVTHLYNSNTFHSYLLTSAGLNAIPIASNIGTNITGNTYYTLGYLKGSMDGSRIAIANKFMDNVELFDFDNSTGLLSNTITFNNFTSPGAYGIEFSPNNNLLYVSESSSGISNIYQYDLQAGSPTAIINSRTTIGSHSGWGGAIQLAPDNKIYHARLYESSLGVINNPNSTGVSCNYVPNGFSLSGSTCNLGLPTFYNSILANSTTFTANNLCFGDSTLFVFSSSNPIDSVLWNFDDPISGNNNTSTDSTPIHIFQNIGTYNVSLITYFGSSSDTTINSIIINPLPTIDLGNDTTLCQGESLTLDATTLNATYLWQDNSTNSTLNISQQGTYWTEVTVNNCSATDTVLIIEEDCEIILEIPNVFTPNNDGINDLFVPIISKGIVSINTIIYNRWGNKIYETNNLLIEWNGQDVNDGTYFWVVYYTDINAVENNLKGHLTILK
ncbi:gliding motility-associated C-terminal domain-containing protein [Flavobacteriales bacterium]|nr:gliding motility-associated C-terminal domain-containing protein [Flavobacteriales bacterium]